MPEGHYRNFGCGNTPWRLSPKAHISYFMGLPQFVWPFSRPTYVSWTLTNSSSCVCPSAAAPSPRSLFLFCLTVVKLVTSQPSLLPLPFFSPLSTSLLFSSPTAVSSPSGLSLSLPSWGQRGNDGFFCGRERCDGFGVGVPRIFRIFSGPINDEGELVDLSSIDCSLDGEGELPPKFGC